MDIGFILLAAGRSSRFEGTRRKQFVKLADRSVLRQALDRIPDVEVVTVVAPPEDPGSVREHLSTYESQQSFEVISGGQTRRGSVWSGLKSLRPTGIDRVLVHDAARPLMPTEVHRQVLQTLSSSVPGAVPVLPVNDTIKRVQTAESDMHALVEKTLDREHLRRVQTPQAFRYDLIYEIHRNWGNDPVTDDAMMLESEGHDVKTTAGSPLGRKITRETDRMILEELYARDLT